MENDKKFPLWMEIALFLIGLFSILAGAYAVIANFTVGHQLRIDLLLAEIAAVWFLYAVIKRIKARKVQEVARKTSEPHKPTKAR